MSFENPPDTPGSPKVGSHAFINLIVGMDKTWDAESGWHGANLASLYVVAQPGEIVARIVLSESLACEVVW